MKRRSLATQSTGVSPIASDEVARGLERRVRLRREHDQVGAADDVLVRAALDAAARAPARGPRSRVARADDDVLAERAQPPRERAAEACRCRR